MESLQIVDKLEELFPEPKCELEYKNNYELLVAVILSAQCTDKRVNIVAGSCLKNIILPKKC